MDNFYKSKYLKATLYVLAALIVLVGVFNLGVHVGFRKANFSYRWGDNYERNFGPSRHYDGRIQGFPGGMMGGFRDRGFINPFGANGKILKIDLKTGDSSVKASSTAANTPKIVATIIVQDRSNVEKVITVYDNTPILEGRTNLKATDLRANENIVVIGEPADNGQISANFIRVFGS